MTTLNPAHVALKKGHTVFLKSVKAPEDVKRLLQPASGNAKLGGGKSVVTKGKWAGMPMYSLTLEERKTCPRTCQQWASCYGNNMAFANRINVKSTDFSSKLRAEIQALSLKHASGFVVRLHVLGDFYSVAYVRFWERMLKQHPNLRIFGYTHRQPDTPIGRAIEKLNKRGAWIRWSDAGDVPMAANVGGAGITCPEQTGKTDSCLTCGLCWTTTRAINFLVH